MNSNRIFLALFLVITTVLAACLGPGAYTHGDGGDFVQEVAHTANGYVIVYMQNNHDVGFCTQKEALIIEVQKVKDALVIENCIELKKKDQNGGIH